MEGPGLWQLPKEDLFWFSMFRHSGYVSQSPHAVQHYTFPNHLSHSVHLPNSSLRWGDSPCELLKAYDGKDTSETAIVEGLKLLVWFAFSHIAEFQVIQPCRLHVWSWLSVTCSKKLISLASQMHRNQLQCVLLCQLPHENCSAPCVVLCGVFYQSVLPTLRFWLYHSHTGVYTTTPKTVLSALSCS